jgi:hypothetical protein
MMENEPKVGNEKRVKEVAFRAKEEDLNRIDRLISPKTNTPSKILRKSLCTMLFVRWLTENKKEDFKKLLEEFANADATTANELKDLL